MEKICPIMSRIHLLSREREGHLSNESMLHEQECLKGRCAFWTGCLSTENRIEYACAIDIIARKRPDGKFDI